MYISTVKVPLITDATLNQLEKVAPGITALHGISVVESAEAAAEVAVDTVRPVLHYRETVGDTSIAPTEDGWIIGVEILEGHSDRMK